MKIKPLRWWEKGLDLLLLPFMYLIAWISGGFKESPQRTHKWNNARLSPEGLDEYLMTIVQGVPKQMVKRTWWDNILFHIPFLGGWRHYAVIAPENPEKGWHPGWHTPHGTGFSRLLCHEPVRLLVGSEPIYFMGFDSQGNQISVEKVGDGKIGVVGPHSNKPLL